MRLIVKNTAIFQNFSKANPKDIPILIPKEALSVLIGNTEPAYVVSEIPFPANGDRGVYEAGFFEDLIAYIKNNGAIGGRKTGHADSYKGFDVYSVGGNIEYAENTKAAGICQLKILIPASGGIHQTKQSQEIWRQTLLICQLHVMLYPLFLNKKV